MKKVLAGLCVAATMAGISGAALAADGGFYGAVDIGQAEAGGACDPQPGIVITRCDDKNTAYRIGAGYQFNQNFGLEASYVDFGKSTLSATVLGLATTENGAADAFQFSATGALPLGESFALTGKLGVARTSLDVSAAVLGVTTTASANSTDLTYGIGVRYNVNKSIAIRAQYEDFGKVGDNVTTGEVKLTLTSIGLSFGF